MKFNTANLANTLISLSALTLGVSSLGLSQAEAASITRTLNCPISSGNCTTGSTSWGTITFTDTLVSSQNAVTISIDLTGSVNKILAFYLNYDDSKFSDSTVFKWNGANNSVGVAENATDIPGGGKGLDLKVPKNGNLNVFDVLSGTLTTTATGGVSVADLGFLTTAPSVNSDLTDIYAAVHIGNYGNIPGQAGGNSITVGAGPFGPVPPDSVPLPPAFLGTLAGAVMGTYKLLKKKKSSAVA